MVRLNVRIFTLNVRIFTRVIWFEEKSQISYITMYGINHHQNDTQSLCIIPTFVLFFVFVGFFQFWPIFI